MNKFKNIIQVTPRLILDTTIAHFDKWTDKTQKRKQGAKNPGGHFESDVTENQ